MRRRFLAMGGVVVGFALAAPAEAYEQPPSQQPEDLEARPRAMAPPREIVAYDGQYAPGTIVVSTRERHLYYILPGNQAVRYGVGVGRPGF